MERETVLHNQNRRPLYPDRSKGSDDDYRRYWDDPAATIAEYEPNEYVGYEPVTFDIETDAADVQRPTLLTAYDRADDRVVIMYDGNHPDAEGLERSDLIPAVERITEPPADVEVYSSLTRKKFEERVLEPIHAANNDDEAADKVLVAHNAPFDLGMMGTAYNGSLDAGIVDPTEYDRAVQYRNITYFGMSAGQFGHMYKFIDMSKGGGKLDIPVADTSVVAKSLWLPAGLTALSEELDGVEASTESDHDGQLDAEYIEYCADDVRATTDAYDALSGRLSRMFGDIDLCNIFSTASLGKSVLKRMGYNRTGYSVEALDVIPAAYFGGNTDARITGDITDNVRYMDVLSQYPTASELTDVWRFMQAETVDIERVPVDSLPELTADDLRDPDAWKAASDYYVAVDAKGAKLPVRTSLTEDYTTKVHIADVEHGTDANQTMYHYFDVVSAGILGDSSDYELKAAYKAVPTGKQDLEATEVGGTEIPADANVMAKAIQERKRLQAEYGGSNAETMALKITANSLYGTTAERLVKEVDGEKHDIAGTFYNPHVAATITAAGRAMLAFGERVAEDNGGELVYCDTDSLTVPEPVADDVQDAFTDLNPYDGVAGGLTVLEDEHEIDCKMFAVGEKKYVLMADAAGIDADGSCDIDGCSHDTADCGKWVEPGDILDAKEHGLAAYDNLRGKDNKGELIINKVWRTLLERAGYGDEITGERFGDNEPVVWKFPASTRASYEMMDSVTGKKVRYGDWISGYVHTGSTTDRRIRVFAKDLMSAEPDDPVLKVVESTDGVETIEVVLLSEIADDLKVKSVNEVIQGHIMDSFSPDGIPKVTIEGHRTITKEATSRVDIFLDKIEARMNKALESVDISFIVP